MSDDVERKGFFIIDAENGFNEGSRILSLWVIRHEWPAGARFVFNCYRHQALLFVRNPNGKPYIITSKEGSTQGDPLAMLVYAMGTLPLIRDLKEELPELHQQ